MTADAFERDLRSTLAALAPDDVPANLHVHAAQLERTPPAVRDWFPRLGSLAVGIVAVVLAVVVAVAAIYVARVPPHVGPGTGLRTMSWATDLARLEADGLRIETGGAVFVGAAERFSVVSDPGTPTYRTLEISWTEQGSDMRLNMYFAADETHWWVSEIRTYDGMPIPDWVTYRGPFFRTERGSAYEGTVDLAGSGRAGGGRLHIDDMRLAAFLPGSGQQPLEGCRVIGPQGLDPLGRPVAHPSDPDLTEYGLKPGMAAHDAYDEITRQGICYEFRLEFPRLNAGQHWCLPPPGKVREFAFGSEGQLLIFVEDTARRTLEPDAPNFIGCN